MVCTVLGEMVPFAQADGVTVCVLLFTTISVHAPQLFHSSDSEITPALFRSDLSAQARMEYVPGLAKV